MNGLAARPKKRVQLLTQRSAKFFEIKSRFVYLSDWKHRFGVGRGLFAAQSDALRARGDAADPARQESRPARRRAVRNRLLCPAPDNRRRGGLERGWINRTSSVSGESQHGKPKYRPTYVDHGKGGFGVRKHKGELRVTKV